MNIKHALLALVVTVSSPLASGQGDTHADLVLRGGTIHTMNPAQPRAEALAIVDDRIAFVGNERDVEAWIGETTRVVNLSEDGPGVAVYPGFADAHAHIVGHGQALTRLDLVGTTSYAEVVERVVAQAESQPSGSWVLGFGWDQNDWGTTDFPHHALLSRAVPDHPVLLRRVDGHALLANQRALDAASADGELVWPHDSGIVHVDDDGPTGVFVDNAMTLIYAVTPATTTRAVEQSIAAAITDFHGHGITAVHDAGIGAAAVELYAKLIRNDAFDLRVHALLAGDDPELTRALRGEDTPFPTPDYTGHGRLAVRGIKLSIDGALGSRGAALLDDYSDMPGAKGLFLVEPAEVEDTARRALRHGFQLCVHAIGDRGNREVLNAFERAMDDVGPSDRAVSSPRFRVEHAQILHPDDIPRFAQLGVIPSMQALHQTSDMPWAGERLGEERLAGAYAWRALLKTGVIIPGGSDAPVETPSVIHGFHASITRKSIDGEPIDGWFPQQVMTRDEALRHVTLWPAIASFDEARLGSIEVGKLADLAVTTGDLMTLEPEWIPRVTVRMTIFGGRVVHDAPGASLAAQREAESVTPAYSP